MTLIAVVLLITLWLGVFVPALVRARQDTSPIVSVGAFRRGMRALSGGHVPRRSGRWIVMPRTPEEIEAPRRRAIRRRRKIFLVLVAGAALSLTFGMIPEFRWLLRLHIAIDFVLAGYVLFLIQAKEQRARYAPRHALDLEPVDEAVDEEEETYLHAGQL